MKYLFAGSFVVLMFFSAVAHFTRPKIEHTRLDQIRFLIAEAGEEAGLSVRAFEALFNELDHNGDAILDAGDFPQAVKARLPDGALDDTTLPRLPFLTILSEQQEKFFGYDAVLEYLKSSDAASVSLSELPDPTHGTRDTYHAISGRFRGLLVLSALWPLFDGSTLLKGELGTIHSRLGAPSGADYGVLLVGEPSANADVDLEGVARQIIMISEADLDDDFAVTANDANEYFARVDANGDGIIDETELPARPRKLVWASDAGPMRMAQIQPFNRRYPQHRLVLDPQANAEDKTIVQCIAGVGPDVFDSSTPFTLAAFVRSGIAMDITEEMHARGIYAEEIWPAVAPFYIQEGRMYGHPRNAGAPAIWYNKDIFDAAGLPYPDSDWTWDELINVADQLTLRDEQGRPVRFGLMNLWDQSLYFPLLFLRQWGGSIFNEAGTRCTLDSPEAVAALQFTQDLMYKHGVMPSPSDESAMAGGGGWGMGGIVIALMGDGKGAMAIGYRWWLALLRQPDFEGIRLGAAPIPEGPSGEVTGAGGAVLVNKECRNLDGALLFMEYLHSEAYNRIVNEQADSIGPVMEYHYGEHEEEFLHNPDFPEEDYNAVWRDALAESVPPSTSPYANGQVVGRVMKKYFDLIKFRGSKQSIADLMEQATQEINLLIIETLKEDPVLREKYYEAIESGAQPAWDNPEDAP